MWIEVAILIAILAEMAQSYFNGKEQKEQNEKIISLLEDSTAELADIRDETVGEEDEQPQSSSSPR